MFPVLDILLEFLYVYFEAYYNKDYSVGFTPRPCSSGAFYLPEVRSYGKAILFVPIK
jgi:hypothetical protein